TDITEEKDINWDWDMKRRLVNWKVNPWIEYSDTLPWKNTEQFQIARMIEKSKLPETEKIVRLENIPEHPNVKDETYRLFPTCKRGRKACVSQEIIQQIVSLKGK